ncbi:MAG: CoA transferase [Acetobacteraceae bacterium]
MANEGQARAMALDSVRVMDFTQMMLGPWSTQFLGDTGADGIKIERPVHGERERGLAAMGQLLGLCPGGGTQRLLRSIGRHATADLLLAGARLTGERLCSRACRCALSAGSVAGDGTREGARDAPVGAPRAGGDETHAPAGS